jgi:hypothetical protein
LLVPPPCCSATSEIMIRRLNQSHFCTIGTPVWRRVVGPHGVSHVGRNGCIGRTALCGTRLFRNDAVTGTLLSGTEAMPLFQFFSQALPIPIFVAVVGLVTYKSWSTLLSSASEYDGRVEQSCNLQYLQFAKWSSDGARATPKSSAERDRSLVRHVGVPLANHPTLANQHFRSAGPVQVSIAIWLAQMVPVSMICILHSSYNMGVCMISTAKPQQRQF